VANDPEPGHRLRTLMSVRTRPARPFPPRSRASTCATRQGAAGAPGTGAWTPAVRPRTIGRRAPSPTIILRRTHPGGRRVDLGWCSDSSSP
jgi:hypothetical protein